MFMEDGNGIKLARVIQTYISPIAMARYSKFTRYSLPQEWGLKRQEDVGELNSAEC